MKRALVFVSAAALVLLAGCGGMFDARQADSAEELAMIASIVASRHEESLLSAVGVMEKEDLEDSTSGARTVSTDTVVRTLPDGTLVTIERSWDDGDTPDDPEDDWVTVTRTFEPWDGASWVETTVRRRRPGPQWSGWVDGELTQEGTTTVEVNGILVREGTFTVTWDLEDLEVVLRRIVKESQGPDRSGAIIVSRTTIEYEGENETRTAEKIRITATEGEVLVSSFTYERIEDPEHPEGWYTRITRDDGCYLIVVQAGDLFDGTPRITEHYTADGVLRARVEQTRSRSSGVVTVDRTVYRYDEDGELLETVERHGTISYEFSEDGVTVTRSFDGGGSVVVEIVELEEGYLVSRDGFTYVAELTGSRVVLRDEEGDEIATVTIEDDGTWVVSYPDPAAAPVEGQL